MAFVVDGNKLAEDQLAALKVKVDQLKGEGITPQLVSLVLKDDESGQTYTRLKKEAGEQIGVNFVSENVEKFDDGRLFDLIKKYNADDKTHGIIIQRPGGKWRETHQLNRELFERKWQQLIDAIDPQKDVDGLRDDSTFTLATVKAIRSLIDQYKGSRRRVIIVGVEGLVGRKLTKNLEFTDLEVTGVDLETEDLSRFTLEAEILVACTGQEKLIKASMVKKEAIVIDVGWPKGDVDFKPVSEKAAVITPVPGGVGPLTVTSLLENLVKSVYDSHYHSHSESSLA